LKRKNATFFNPEEIFTVPQHWWLPSPTMNEKENVIIFAGMYLALFLGLLLNLGNLLSLGAGSRNLHTEDDVP
jgi:hypothetical protein